MTATTSAELAGVLPAPDQVREARALLDASGVKYVLSCWVDLLGSPKTKPVPVEQWEELCAGRGPQFAAHSISMVPELGPADPDQVPVPDLGSLVVCPWNTDYAWMFADLYFNGAPYAGCPRSALRRQIELAGQAGYRFYAGIEPEFIVMRYDSSGRPVKAFDDDPPVDGGQPKLRRQAFGYDAEFSLDSMPFLEDVGDMLGQLGWGMSNLVAEGAYSQFELDYGYTDLLGAADRLTFLRIMLKEVAKRHGYFVTFMAKPTQGDWRSGAHINHSVRAIDNPEENLFAGTNGEWGRAALQAIAGLMRHAPALTALACSTVNSYKGLIARASSFEGGTVTWAPTHICYGANNRSATFRFPQARWAIENRAADMCMNPYLALAVTAAASLEGITQGLEPGPPVNTDLYELTPLELREAGIEPLPGTLLEAVEAFDRDELVREVLGPTIHAAYSRYKRDEWARFHEHITEWEAHEYLRFF
jgi:glutamine synthetase